MNSYGSIAQRPQSELVFCCIKDCLHTCVLCLEAKDLDVHRNRTTLL